MPWPWVSRERLDEAQRELRELRADNRYLRDLLIEKPKPAAIPVPQPTVEEDASGTRGDLVAFGNPFDSIGRKFDKVLLADKQKYRARA